MIEMYVPSDIWYYVVPFVFSFAVVYGSIELSGVFKNKAVNAIISLAIAAMSIVNESVVSALWEYMPVATIVFVALFIVGFIWKFINSLGSGDSNADYGVVGAILFLILIGFGSPTIRNSIHVPNSTTITFIVGFIVVAILFILASKMGMFGNSQSTN